MPLLLLALLATQPDDTCEQVAKTVRAAQRLSMAPQHGPSSVQLTMIPSFCVGWTVIDIDTERSPRDERQIVLRRQRRDGLGRVTIEWTDDARCPAVRGMVDELTAISLSVRPAGFEAPPTAAPGKFPVPPPPPPEDGVEHILRIWSSGQADGSRIRIETSSNYGPVVRWADRHLPPLERCWSAERT